MKTSELYQTIREVFVLLEFGNHETLAPFQLDNIAYSTLQLLDLKDGLRLVDLRERLLCDKSKMTRIIDTLEARGLVQRHPDPSDRRAWQVFLTQEGLSLRQQTQMAFQAALDQRFSAIDPGEQIQLQNLLDTLRAQLLLARNHK